MPDAIPRGPFDQGLFLAHFNKGREAFDARLYDEAERQLEEAYLLRPRDARVLNLLGLVYFRADKLIKAEEVYRKLIAQNPEAHTLYYNLGLICFKLTRLEEAEQALRKAAELSGGNPKIHFYLASIYERLQRYKDAIHNYRQAGANLMVQRLQGKMERSGSPETTRPPQPAAESDPAAAANADRHQPPEPAAGAEPNPEPHERPHRHATDEATLPPLPPITDEDTAAFLGDKVLLAVSPALLASDASLVEGAGEPGDRVAPPAGDSARAPADAAVPAVKPPNSAADAAEPPAGAEISHAFRSLERAMIEVEFTGRVFIKQGTIYSYTGNLTFWVKDERSGSHPPLAIVTGTGRLLLTDHDREITLLQVTPGEPVFVEPAHLLACQEGLEPRFQTIADQTLIALEGRGTVALSVASKPLELTVTPAQPVSIPASSVIAWIGALGATVIEDPQVYAVVMQPSTAGGRLLRLEGAGRVLVEHAGA